MWFKQTFILFLFCCCCGGGGGGGGGGGCGGGGGGGNLLSKLVFYAQSTDAVISGRCGGSSVKKMGNRIDTSELWAGNFQL